jgi:hypothetical protein
MLNLDIEGAMVVILSIQRAVADLSLLRWRCNNPIRFATSHLHNNRMAPYEMLLWA